MARVLLLFFFLSAGYMFAQHPCAINKAKALERRLAETERLRNNSSGITGHEHKYDMKFVHLDLEISDTTKFISGSSKMIAEVSATALDTYVVFLHQNLVVDSVWFNGTKHSFLRSDSAVKIKPVSSPAQFAAFTAQVWYHGAPPVGGSALGDGFSSEYDLNYGQDVTWSLSEPFVAYHWWPAKQVLTDKIDSSWVFITTDSTNMAGSNGVLKNIALAGSKKRFEWKSAYPIAYYLISVAVAKYKEYNIYAKPLYLNDSIKIQNFVYKNATSDAFWINYEKPQINMVADMVEIFSRYYGMYPFYKEKYGHCMAYIGGGMEHQTMSTMGTMAYFFLNAHELGHQWWGDNVTCASWSDIFINEGFASYSQLIAYEHISPGSAYASHLNAMHNSVMTLPGGSIHFTGTDTMKPSRIFDGRLTYDKGGAILHTLRFLTNNDSLWFKTLRDFQHTYKGKTATVKNFRDFYQTTTNIDPTVFFDQWYYGEGYPTFNAKYNFDNTNLFLEVTQTTSMPAKTPLFVTPVEYRIYRKNMPDTTIRLMHAQPHESYTIALTGQVNTILIDDKNWLINKAPMVKRDITIEIPSVSPHDLLTVYPNPSAGEFFIENPGQAQGHIALYDITGRKLHDGALEKTRSLGLRASAPGVYFLTVTIGGETRTHKLIKH